MLLVAAGSPRAARPAPPAPPAACSQFVCSVATGPGGGAGTRPSSSGAPARRRPQRLGRLRPGDGGAGSDRFDAITRADRPPPPPPPPPPRVVVVVVVVTVVVRVLDLLLVVVVAAGAAARPGLHVRHFFLWRRPAACLLHRRVHLHREAGAGAASASAGAPSPAPPPPPPARRRRRRLGVYDVGVVGVGRLHRPGTKHALRAVRAAARRRGTGIRCAAGSSRRRPVARSRRRRPARDPRSRSHTPGRRLARRAPVGRRRRPCRRRRVEERRARRRTCSQARDEVDGRRRCGGWGRRSGVEVVVEEVGHLARGAPGARSALVRPASARERTRRAPRASSRVAQR